MRLTEPEPRALIAAFSRPARPWVLLVFAAMAALGAGAFLVAVLGTNPQRAWQAYLVNLVFWTGLAAGGVLFSAILSITHAFWGRPMKRLAESLGGFLPVALLLFLMLYPGRIHVFPWIVHPVEEKAAWLNVPFLFLRDGAGLLVLAGAGLTLIYLSVRRETAALAGRPQTVSAGPRDREEPVAVVWANIYAILYALILSLIAFDLIMSLSPHWHSTLFGAYFFVSSFFSALAGLMILAAVAIKRLGLSEIIKPLHMHKLGKLMLGFTLMTGDFFFTQFLVIWYGNLPEETGFVILRSQFAPWKTLAWTVLAVCFILPFVTLLNRRIKMNPSAMLVLSSVILIGMWLERFLLVVPSLWQGPGLPLGITELLITLGFAGLMGLCILIFLSRFPVLAFADPLLRLDGENITTTPAMEKSPSPPRGRGMG